MKAKITAIGHFGEGKKLLNGQTVKTKTVTEELQKNFGQDEVLKCDTHGGWKILLKAPFQTFQALRGSKNVLIFPAHNGLRVYAPLLSFQRRLFKNRKLHYVVIGGWLPEFLSKHKSLVRSLKNFDGIYVETKTMKKALETQGLENVFVMPNCKKLSALSEDELVYPKEIPYKLCTFSRVMKEKGIEDAVDAVKIVNDSVGYNVFSLDIYGQVEDLQTDWFDDLKQKFPSYVNYAGIVPFDESVKVLKDYFALLFPTCYDGEGFAGTLIDSYSAGVPVIASDWKYNSELVNDKVGYLYKTKDQEALVGILKNVAATPMLLLEKKRACLNEARKYEIDKVIRVLIEQIERD